MRLILMSMMIIINTSAINDWHLDKQRIKEGRKVNEGFSYSSENNEDWMNIDSLTEWVRENYSE